MGENTKKLKLLVTQNVDGLHQQAGNSPELVVEVHGSLRESECLQCGHREPLEDTVARLGNSSPEPRCSKCSGGPVKAAVVLFGEQLPMHAMESATQAAESSDVIVAVGTTLGVWPVA